MHLKRTYLIEMRKKKNESQRDVASAIGMSHQYYSFIENGERKRKGLDVITLGKFAAHFGTSTGLLMRSEQKYCMDILKNKMPH